MTNLPAVPEGHAISPATGELLDLTYAPAAAQFVVDARAFEERLKGARRFAEETLLEESKRLGKKTYMIERAKISIAGGPVTEYDIEILGELVAAGLPEERFKEIVPLVCEYKPKAGMLKQLASANPVYSAIIERARNRVEKPFNVKVDSGGTA